MKLNRRQAIGLTGAAFAGQMAGPAFAAGNRYNWTIATGHAPNFVWIKAIQEHFVPTLQTRIAENGDQLSLVEAYSGTLLKIGSEIDGLKSRIADFSLVGAVFHQSSLPMQMVSLFSPFSVKDVGNAVTSAQDVSDQVPEFAAEWEASGLVKLGGVATESLQLFTKQKITSLDQIDGLKVGAAGPPLNWLRGTGAIPVSLTPATIYNDLQTGIYDAILTSPSAALGLKLYEVTPFMLKADFNAAYWAAFTMSKAAFDPLSEETKSAIKFAGAAYEQGLINLQRASDANALSTLQSISVDFTLTEMQEAGRQDWANSLPDLASEWAAPLEEAGLPAQRIMRLYMDALKSRGETPLRDWSVS
ncbi:TRAP transporter substrate-binding protein DctP [Puniceibacterium sp. IMCC21224]|uniref:TRAP transporter substrate-binding protein DctP n=1 Tax=Puniceibacterium sp. IMCC21224 TaxID=1618204 RepID=UPI00064DED04|nr:TRAP transporter substrate-binding protein DctP [Puniceibacterium sp. IMCC21224]